MYIKSNIRHDKIKTQNFQAPANFIREEKVYLWTDGIIISGHSIKGGLCCFFKKSTSISDYIHFYDSDSLLIRKTTLKMHSLETTLATLIYIKIILITDYADNDDIQGNMNLKLTTIVVSLSLLTTWFSIPDEKWFHHWLRWLHLFARLL